MLRIDSGVSYSRQDLGCDTDQTEQNDEQRQSVHPWQSIAPSGERNPETTDDDDDFDAKESEQSASALALIRPEGEGDPEGKHKNQSGASADHGGTLLRTLLGAPLLLALHLLECRRRLGRQSLEFPLDFFELC
ncbi:MAG TPA: hypothetical protein VEK37_16170 [Gemmatimonadaceae bacterium]|nr:hypothetical protein [Gemmatimonadaceae bacterium]